MSDVLVAQARQHHREAEAAAGSAKAHREVRNAAIRRLRTEDPRRWTYRALAHTVGCSEELIAAIVQGRTG